MDKERLFRYLDRKYSSRNEIIPNIPLGEDADALWAEILQKRRERGIVLPLTNLNGEAYWYILTNKMISASEVIVEELLEQDHTAEPHTSSVSTIEEIYYTGFMEGAQISVQEAMEFLQSGDEPENVEELILLNSRQAAGFAAENMYHAIDGNYLHNLAYFLTEGLDNGGGEFRMTDTIEIPSMQGETVMLPAADMIPEQTEQFTRFLADTGTHPLIKAAAAQAWVLAYRPFPEGNERLARLLSNVILIRAGYTFFGNISISSVLARTSYDYFRAIANILRVENGADLTYFLEYYLVTLSTAVNDMRAKRQQQEETMIEEEQKMAAVPLNASPAAVSECAVKGNPVTRNIHEKNLKKIEDALEELMQQGCVQFTLGDLEDITGIERKQIRRLLLPFEAAERITAVRKSHMGNIYAFTQPALPDDETAETIVQSETVKTECDSRTYVISALKEKMKTGIGHARTIAQELLDYIQEGKMQFTTHEIAKELDISYIGTRNSLAYYFKNGMIRHADPKVNNQCFVFSFVPENYETATGCEHDICNAPAVESTAEPQFNVFQETTKQNICYSDAVMDMITVLEKSETSQKDRRIGRIIRQCLTKGKVMKDDYSAEGEQSKWNPDMRFAVQLGLLEKVSSSEYTIRTELDSTCKNLGTTQKCTLSVLYDIFGDGMFSVDMAVANLDYSSSYVSGILHQFTMLKLLDCTPNEDNSYSYQLNVNPEDNPECFEDVA